MSHIVVSLSGFVATFAIAVLLGAATLGDFAVATSLGFFWMAIPGTAVGKAVNKRISETDDPAAYFSTGIAFNLVVGILLSLGIYLVGLGLPLVFDPRQIAFVDIVSTYKEPIAVLVFATYLYRMVSGGLQGQKRVATASMLKSLERICRTLAQVGAIAFGFGVSALLFGHVLALVITSALGLYIIEIRLVKPKADHFYRLASFAKYAWMGSLRGRVFGWMDTMVLAFFVSSTLIGIYEVAWGIASLLAVISGSIQRTLFPEVSELSAEAAYDQVVHFLDEGLVFAGVFVIPGLFGASIIGTRVLEFYRPEFSQGTGILLILILAYLFDVYASQFLNVMNAIDEPNIAFRVNYLFIGTNLVLNVLLIWWISWYGAAIATTTSSGLRLALGYMRLHEEIGRLSLPIREISEEVLAASVMAVLVFVVQPFAMDGRIGTLLLVGFGAVVYGITLLSISGRIRAKALSFATPATEWF